MSERSVRKAVAISGVVAVAYWLVTAGDPRALNMGISVALTMVAGFFIAKYGRMRKR